MTNPVKAGGATRGRPRPSQGPDSAATLKIVQGSLDDDQAEELVVVDLRGKSNMADALVIASARNPRHMRAMADHLKQRLKDAGAPAPPIEGLEQCIWVLVDAGDVIVHLFRPEMRGIYNLEKMWGAQLPEPRGSSSRSAPDGGA